MRKGFVASVLSGSKQRQRFFWARNIISVLCAAAAFQSVGGVTGVAIAGLVLFTAYFTIAPVAAFIACFIEQAYF